MLMIEKKQKINVYILMANGYIDIGRVYRVKAQHDKSTTNANKQCMHIYVAFMLVSYYFIFPVYIIIKLVGWLGGELLRVNYPCSTKSVPLFASV